MSCSILGVVAVNLFFLEIIVLCYFPLDCRIKIVRLKKVGGEACESTDRIGLHKQPMKHECT